MRHRWPGNVRELENALRVASLFAESTVIGPADLTANVDNLRNLAPPSRPALSSSFPPPPEPSSPATEESADDSATMCDADSDTGESDTILPQIEANATSVAYAQVRQGAVSLSDMKRQIERDCIARALAETKGNITRAATLLGMKRPRLSQLVKQYGLAAVFSEGSG
jgi:DNA-binding NtrC family response regulator